MAIVVASGGFGVYPTSVTGNQTSSSTFVIGMQGTFGANTNDVIFVGISADNAGSSGTSAISSVTDSQGNTYTLKVQNRTAANGINDGVTAGLAWARIKGPWQVGDTITVNFSTNVTAKAASFFILRGIEDIEYSTSGLSGTGTTVNSGNTATASLNAGDCIVAAVASESNTQPSTDTDTTNGSWASGAGYNSGGTGNDVTKVSGLLEYKIVNASGTQTLNGTTANSDWAAVWALFAPAATVSDSDATASSADAEVSLVVGDVSYNPKITTVVSAAGGKRGQSVSQSTGIYSGAGGAAVDGIGSIKYSGGNGGVYQTNATVTDLDGGGGGSSAGTSANGGNGGIPTAGVAPTGGGDGGIGAVASTSAVSTAGTQPGGGGGGGYLKANSTRTIGSNGAGGRVKFTYNDPLATVHTYNNNWVDFYTTGVETVPSGASSVLVECWGAGGAGGAGTIGPVSSGGGGGGGAYSAETVSLSGVLSFNYYVGGRNADSSGSANPSYVESVTGGEYVVALDGQSIGATLDSSDQGSLTDDGTVALLITSSDSVATDDAFVSTSLDSSDTAETVEDAYFLVTSSDTGNIWDIAPPTVLTESFNKADVEGDIGPDLVWEEFGYYAFDIYESFTDVNTAQIVGNKFTARAPSSAAYPWDWALYATATILTSGFTNSLTETTVTLPEYGYQFTTRLFARATTEVGATFVVPQSSWSLYLSYNAANTSATAIRFKWEEAYGVHGWEWNFDDPDVIFADGDRIGFGITGSATEPTLTFWLNGVVLVTFDVTGDAHAPSSYYAPIGTKVGLSPNNSNGGSCFLDDFSTIDLTEVSLETVEVLDTGASHATIVNGRISVHM